MSYENLPELHCEDKNSHISTITLMEYLNNYQARERDTNGIGTNTQHISPKITKDASILEQ